MSLRARWRSDPELLNRPALPKADFDAMCAEIGAERDKDAREFNPFSADERASQAFLDSVQCGRWGSGDDRCILAFEHLGPCVDARGNSTLTLAADILRGRK